MDSLICPGTDKLRPSRVIDPPRSSTFVDLTSQNELCQRNQRTCGYEPQASSSFKGEMDVPVVDNSFSLPQNVFERVLASSTRVTMAYPSTPKGFASPFVNYCAGQQQQRRTSGDCAIELTGSEAKRPRLSPPITSEQDIAQRRHNPAKQLEREQFKLQILRRLDSTKSNILKLLKLQHMQNLVHYYENDPISNQADKSGSSQISDLQFHSQQGSAHERQYQTPTLAPMQNAPRPASVSTNAQGMNRSSHLHSSSHSFRRVPGISIVTTANQWKEQGTSYSYKSSDSVGLAWDHKTLPKIVAVHSVINDANASATKTVNRPALRTAVGRAEYAHEKGGIKQKQMQAPVISLASEVDGRVTAVTDRRYSHEDEEVVVTNVLPRKPRCSISTEQPRTKTNSNHNERSAVERESSPNDLQVNGRNFARIVLDTSYDNKDFTDHVGHVEHSGLLTENTAHTEHSKHFNYPGHSELSRHVGYPGHVEHPGHADPTGHSVHTRRGDVEIAEQIDLTNGHGHTFSSMTSLDSSQIETIESQNHVHPGSLQYLGNADSEVYLGGPPPYLPVLDSSEMADREKERRSPSETGERRGSNPTSPRLTKTIPEIQEKLAETRERMKNETIEWKKKILYKLEKRLIMKLRRAKGSTGQRTEIEDLSEEGAGKGKKHESPRLYDRRADRRGSAADSVTDSVTDDDDETPERSDNLQQESVNVEESGDELRKCPQEDKRGKDHVMDVKDNCEDVSAENKQVVEIPCTEEETTEYCEISPGVIKEEKVEKCSKRFCNGFEEPLNAAEEERNVKSDESMVIVDCVTNEHCEEVKFHSEEETRSGSGTSCTVSANVTQHGETGTPISAGVSESRQVKSEQSFQGTKNLFEAFSSGFQAPALKKDKLQLPENIAQASPITTQKMFSSPPETKEKDTPAEIKKLAQKMTNLSSLKKRLQTCSKEVLKKKTETVKCDRNIWSVLKRDGIS